ncbi:2-dehydropantoate 2-reductase [Pseudohaliea sp.]|uniref:ketopantoate reductase family protein n=1 Tax=Pseudohaliea sp. TaxID=2740289 RepID=UPI0032EB2C6A
MTDDTATPWHILGAGAMGTLFAHRLEAAGVPVVLVAREAGTMLVHTLRSANGDSEREFAVEGPASPGTVRRLLVTVKAPSVTAAVAALGPRLAADAVVVVLANGRGYREALAPCLGGRPLYRGVTSEGAWRESASVTVHAGEGRTSIGNPAGEPLPPRWFTAGPGRLPRVGWDAAIEQALWEKLAVNCVINGITALHGCRNGALLTDPAARRDCEALLLETVAALRALGRPQLAAALPGTVAAVLRATAANRSSMLADRLAGRETEIDYINGFLVARCAAQGGRLPHHTALLERVRALQPTLASGAAGGSHPA